MGRSIKPAPSLPSPEMTTPATALQTRVRPSMLHSNPTSPLANRTQHVEEQCQLESLGDSVETLKDSNAVQVLKFS
eukprot:5488969-Amphidinium_carterae.1